MKTNQTSDEDGALAKVLGEWRVDAPLPARFQERVWLRIGQAESSQPTLRLWLSRVFVVLLPRPKVALAYVSVLLALGITAGSITAQIKSNRLESELSRRYVQSIDPYRAELPLP